MTRLGRSFESLIPTDLIDEEFDLTRVLRVIGLQGVTHTVLLFLVAAEDPDLPDIRGQEMLQNRGAERPRSACNHKYFVFE